MSKKNRSTKRRQEAPRQLLLPVSAMLLDGLHEVVVQSGLEAVGSMLEADRAEACGPRYAHQDDRVRSSRGHCAE